MASVNDTTLYAFLDHFLCDFEGSFLSDGQPLSWEAAQNYVDAAKYCERRFGRTPHYARHVEEWMMKQVTEEIRTPADYDYNY